MKQVYSFYSNIYIPKRNFQAAFDKIKNVYLYDKEIHSATSLARALSLCGWIININSFKDELLSLKYDNDSWTIKSEDVLKVLAPFVLTDGSIKIANDKMGMYYHFIIENGELKKRNLIKEFIDNDSIQQQESLFIRSARNLIRLGITSNKLKNIIKELFVESILS